MFSKPFLQDYVVITFVRTKILLKPSVLITLVIICK